MSFSYVCQWIHDNENFKALRLDHFTLWVAVHSYYELCVWSFRFTEHSAEDNSIVQPYYLLRDPYWLFSNGSLV